MKHTLKNVPTVYCEAHENPALESCSKKDMEKLHQWFEGFEKKHHDFYCSPYLVENWLVDHDDLPNNEDIAHAIRVFIKEEVLGEEL